MFIKLWKIFKMKKSREIAIEILNEFEELLDYHQIEIPDEDRESGSFEARLYGTTYYSLEDKINRIIEDLLIKENIRNE